MYEELERTIENNGYEADLNVRMTYYHNVSRKQQEVILKVKSTVLILIIIKKFMICSLSKIDLRGSCLLRKISFNFNEIMASLL